MNRSNPYVPIFGRSWSFNTVTCQILKKVPMRRVLTIRYEVETVEASQDQPNGHIDQMMDEKDL